MTKLTDVISTQLKNSASLPMTVADNETIITLDVFPDGENFRSHIALQHSPDSTNWVSSNQVTNGSKSITVTLATAYVRACVVVGEGTAQTATIFITAK